MPKKTFRGGKQGPLKRQQSRPKYKRKNHKQVTIIPSIFSFILYDEMIENTLSWLPIKSISMCRIYSYDKLSVLQLVRVAPPMKFFEKGKPRDSYRFLVQSMSVVLCFMFNELFFCANHILVIDEIFCILYIGKGKIGHICNGVMG